MRTRGLVAGVLVAALAPTFVATDAQGSAVLGSSISLRVSKPVIDEGERTVLSGHARGFAPGSRVLLDRLRRGEWVRRDADTLTATHDFRFRVRPPRGDHRFRVSVVDPDGRRAAKAATVLVRWTPEIDATVRWTRDAADDLALVVRGSTSFADDPRTRLAWEVWDESVSDWDPATPWIPVVDGRFRATGFALPGTLTRVRLPGNGSARQDATAELVVPPFGLSPLVFRLNDPAGTGDPSTSSFVDNLIDLPAEVSVTLHGADRHDYREILDPKGRALSIHQGHDLTVTVTTTQAGRYTIRRHPGGSGALYASTPKVYEGELDAPLHYEPDVPGQLVDVRFAARTGDLVTVGSGMPWGEVLDPAGEPVVKPDDFPFGLPLALDGTYTMRYDGARPGTFDLRRIFQTTAEVGGAAVELPSSEHVVVTIPARAGQAFYVSSPGCVDAQLLGAALLDPQGRDLGWLYEVVPATDGDYRLFFWPQNGALPATIRAQPATELPITVDGPAVSFSAPTPRCHLLRAPFTGTAGQIVRLAATDSQDALWRWQTLETAAGVALREVGDGIYRLPADGEYAARWSTQYYFGPEEPWNAELEVSSVAPRPMPADGSAIPLAADPGTFGLLGHVDVPAGTRVTVTLPDLEWPPRVDIHGADGASWGWVGRGQLTASFTVNQPGGAYLYASTSELSTVTLTISTS